MHYVFSPAPKSKVRNVYLCCEPPKSNSLQFIEIVYWNHLFAQTSFFGRQHLFGNQLSLFTNLCLIIEVPFWKRQHLFANQLSLWSGLVNMARINKLGTMKLLPCEIFNGGAEIRFIRELWMVAGCMQSH